MSEQPVSTSLKEQLVAYLDGELDETGMREVESLLSTDPRARQALRQLETAWDLLEELPRAEVDKSFTESTIEIVAVSLEKDLEREQAARPSQELRKWGLAAAAVLAASVLGYLGVRSVMVDPNLQLLKDLPLLERLHQYRQVEDLEFLKALHAANLLPEAAAQSEEPTTMPDRRMLVEQMDPVAKEALLEKSQRFAELPPDDQERLRQLHEGLQKDSAAAELRGVMAAYYDWLLKLSPPQRASLASIDAAARVEKVKTLRLEEIRRTADKVEPADLEKIAAWLEPRIRESMPEDRRAAIDALRPEDRLGATMLWATVRPPGSPSRQPEVTAENIAELREQLSPAGKAKLDSLGTDESRRRALAGSFEGWIPHAMRDSVRRYFESMIADVPQSDLVTFFEQLPEKEKDNLQKMSADYRDHRLRVQYVLENCKSRLPEHARNLKPDMLTWLRWGRGDTRWSGGFRDRDGSRSSGPPPFVGAPQEGRPLPRRPLPPNAAPVRGSNDR